MYIYIHDFISIHSIHSIHKIKKALKELTINQQNHNCAIAGLHQGLHRSTLWMITAFRMMLRETSQRLLQSAAVCGEACAYLQS